MTARQRFRTGCYYTLGAVWAFVALAILLTVPVAAIVGLIVIVRAALTWAGVI